MKFPVISPLPRLALELPHPSAQGPPFPGVFQTHQTALYNCFNKNLHKHKKRKRTDISTLTSKMEKGESSSQEKNRIYKKKSQLFRQIFRPHPSAASLDLSSSDAGGVLRKEDMLDPPSPSHFFTRGKNYPPGN